MFKKLLLVLASLVSFSNPACATTYIQTSYPRDAVSEAKFPGVDYRLIDELTLVNKLANHGITYEYDSDQYGEDDLWVMNPKSGKGDCEDYALTKIYLIGKMMNADKTSTDPISSLNYLSDMKPVSVLVYYDDHDGLGVQQDGHMILAVRLPNHQVAYLDLIHDELMTRKELQKWHTIDTGETLRYEFQWDWKA